MQEVENGLEPVLVSPEPQSPFLPGTQVRFAWDSTCLGALKRCPRLYQYTMLDGWSSREDAPSLRFGIEYHQALQDYDLSRAQGIPHDDSLHDITRALLIRTADWHSDHKYKNRDALVRTTIWYLDQFRDDVAKTHILENGKAAVEVSFRFELDWGPQSQIDIILPDGTLGTETINAQPYLLCGHLDRIVSFHDELFVMDHKTTTSTPSDYYFARYEPDNQMTLYTLASQVIMESPVRGVIIDVAQVTQGFSRFVRGITYRTPDQLDEWLQSLEYWFGLAEHFAVQNFWPMNDTACDKFGGCAFRQVCAKSPQIREQYLKSNFNKLEESERWNPLKVR